MARINDAGRNCAKSIDDYTTCELVYDRRSSMALLVESVGHLMFKTMCHWWTDHYFAF